MYSSNSFSTKWLSIIIPLIRQIQRIVELKNEAPKERLFQIQLTLFGAAEDLKAISDTYIEEQVFAAAKKSSKCNTIQKILIEGLDIEAEVFLN